jgi:hypothetical protein
MPSRLLAADRWAALLDAADCHGVLPAAVANARRVLAAKGRHPSAERSTRGEGILASSHQPATGIECEEQGQDALATLEEALAGAKDRLIGRAALSLLIRGQIRGVAAEFKASGVPVAVLKGADFADHLYPDPSLRPFTDLDLLVPEQAVPDAEKAISRLGYVPCEVSMKYSSGYGERSWVRPDRHEGTVEIHWNLVNSPTIRRGVSVAWEDLAFESGSETSDGISCPTAPARLLIAAVHAAASHGFDRLGPLYDICLASRRCESEADICRLSAAVQRTGAGLPLAASLALCRRLFDEPACARLQAAMRLPNRGVWSVLLTPGVVLRGHSRFDSIKRQLFRELLKRR